MAAGFAGWCFLLSSWYKGIHLIQLTMQRDTTEPKHRGMMQKVCVHSGSLKEKGDEGRGSGSEVWTRKVGFGFRSPVKWDWIQLQEGFRAASQLFFIDFLLKKTEGNLPCSSQWELFSGLQDGNVSTSKVFCTEATASTTLQKIIWAKRGLTHHCKLITCHRDD